MLYFWIAVIVDSTHHSIGFVTWSKRLGMALWTLAQAGFVLVVVAETARCGRRSVFVGSSDSYVLPIFQPLFDEHLIVFVQNSIQHLIFSLVDLHCWDQLTPPYFLWYRSRSTRRLLKQIDRFQYVFECCRCYFPSMFRKKCASFTPQVHAYTRVYDGWTPRAPGWSKASGR